MVPLTLVALLVALGIAELVLRGLGFEYQLRIAVVEGTAPNPETVLDYFHIDPDLIWVPAGYEESVARAAAERAEIVFMGDSCTHLGRYPEFTAQLLQNHVAPRPLPWANLGVAGWTTVQGLEQMRRDVARIRPRIATLYYGWNDHWLSIGIEDREALSIVRRPIFQGQRLRLQQLLLKSWVVWRSDFDHRPLRVPLPTFREALVGMVRAARAMGTTPVLLTPPTSHRPGAEPEYLRGRWIEDLAQLVPLHQEYVAAIREVAVSQGVALCDLADRFAAEPAWMVPGHYFRADGIHLQEAGDRRLSVFLEQCFESEGLLPVLASNRGGG